MDILFGAITQEQRDADVARRVDEVAAKKEEKAEAVDEDLEKSEETRTEKV